MDKETANKTENGLKRIKNIIAETDTLLKTGLMVEVSTAPVLKPPIARTNVLLQNTCFSKALELYDYLVAYNGNGYTVKELYKQSGALKAEARADYAELIAVTSYLSYRSGGLYDELEETLILADLGLETAVDAVEQLRSRVRKEKLRDQEEVKAALEAEKEERKKAEKAAANAKPKAKKVAPPKAKNSK